MIRVVIADDHPVARRALARLLDGADEITVVETASNGGEAVAAALEHSPDVVLMDLEMPGQNGIEATHALTTAGSEARVVILTRFSDRRRILAALDAGAVGYLLKDAEHEEIIRGVQAAAAGDAPLAPRAAREMLAERVRQRNEPDLSERELEVLRLVARGMPNKLIARELEISEKTVKAHLTSVFSQLGVSDRTQAALWAQRPSGGSGRRRCRVRHGDRIDAIVPALAAIIVDAVVPSVMAHLMLALLMGGRIIAAAACRPPSR